MRAVMTVPNVSCEHCEHAIKRTLEPVVGVRSVQVDIPGKRVSVDYDVSGISIDRLCDLLAGEDYPVSEVSEERI